MNEAQKIMKEENYVFICDTLFGFFRIKNDGLLKKSNDTYDVTFDEVIDFSISSNALSIIKSYFYGSLHSYTTILLCRNIIEDFALKEMLIHKKVPEASRELVKLNGYIEDYKQYKHLKGNEFKKVIDYTKLAKDYQNSLNEYAKYGIREKDITKMDIPFLLNKKLTYIKIIEECIPEFMDYYKLLSYYVHPHNYTMEESEENLDIIFVNLVKKLLDYYQEEMVSSNCNYRFNSERALFLGFLIDSPENYSLVFLNKCIEENKLLNDLQVIIEKHLGKNNYVAHLLKILPNMIYDLATDSVHGQSENSKMKFKTILEIFAVYDWLFFNIKYSEDFFYLLNYYSIIKEYEIYQKDNESNYKEAFKIYLRIYPNSKDIDKFKKTFGKTLGFTIDGNYNKLSINDLINRYIKGFENQKIIGPGNLTTLMQVLYYESCSLGHGKGYSFFANTGAFMDENVITLTDYMICMFLQKYNLVLKVMDEEKEYIEISDSIDKTIKEIMDITNKKNEYMQLKIKDFDFSKWNIKNPLF